MNYQNYNPYALVPRRPVPQRRPVRRLMSGIDDPVRKGAPTELAVEFTDWAWDTSFRELPDVLATISNKLTASGVFQGLARAYQLAGTLNPFCVFSGYAGRDYAHSYELRDAILSIIASEYPDIDYGTVRFQTETYSPTTQQTQQTRIDTPEGSGPTPPPGSQTSLFDDLAKSLGVQKSEAQLLIFGGGALLLILAMGGRR